MRTRGFGCKYSQSVVLTEYSHRVKAFLFPGTGSKVMGQTIILYILYYILYYITIYYTVLYGFDNVGVVYIKIA